ncbi:MAG: efflux RND transporter permease subunit, partial [Deltaproteobacteria bacterium]|nr:efflux RND transporter permease subunit [Deltaproteobacteria bacterium]
VNFSVNSFLTERIEETISGFTAPVVVRLFGHDLDDLDRRATRAARILRGIPGAVGVRVQSPPGTPELVIRLRPADLARWGLTPVDVLDAVRTAFQGTSTGQVYEGNRAFDVVVILDPRARRSVADVGRLPLRGPGGTFVRLGQVADVYETQGRYGILHDGARRVQVVTAEVAGRDVGSFVADVRGALSGEALPRTPGSTLEIGGTGTEQRRSRNDLLMHSLLVGVGIFLLLWVVMGNLANLLLVLANVPFALVGGVAVVLASGGTLTMGSMVGFVTLFGITLRNSIMMISHYDHLVRVEGAAWGPGTAVRGAAERLAPILMTVLVTGFGLLPLAVGSNAPGREIEGPMAVVILGGLVTSTLLNLFVLPVLTLRYGRFPDAPDGAAEGT